MTVKATNRTKSKIEATERKGKYNSWPFTIMKDMFMKCNFYKDKHEKETTKNERILKC